MAESPGSSRDSSLERVLSRGAGQERQRREDVEAAAQSSVFITPSEGPPQQRAATPHPTRPRGRTPSGMIAGHADEGDHRQGQTGRRRRPNTMQMAHQYNFSVLPGPLEHQSSAASSSSSSTTSSPDQTVSEEVAKSMFGLQEGKRPRRRAIYLDKPMSLLPAVPGASAQQPTSAAPFPGSGVSAHPFTDSGQLQDVATAVFPQEEQGSHQASSRRRKYQTPSDPASPRAGTGVQSHRRAATDILPPQPASHPHPPQQQSPRRPASSRRSPRSDRPQRGTAHRDPGQLLGIEWLPEMGGLQVREVPPPKSTHRHLPQQDTSKPPTSLLQPEMGALQDMGPAPGSERGQPARASSHPQPWSSWQPEMGATPGMDATPGMGLFPESRYRQSTKHSRLPPPYGSKLPPPYHGQPETGGFQEGLSPDSRMNPPQRAGRKQQASSSTLAVGEQDFSNRPPASPIAPARRFDSSDRSPLPPTAFLPPLKHLPPVRPPSEQPQGASDRLVPRLPSYASPHSPLLARRRAASDRPFKSPTKLGVPQQSSSEAPSSRSPRDRSPRDRRPPPPPPPAAPSLPPSFPSPRSPRSDSPQSRYFSLPLVLRPIRAAGFSPLSTAFGGLSNVAAETLEPFEALLDRQTPTPADAEQSEVSCFFPCPQLVFCRLLFFLL